MVCDQCWCGTTNRENHVDGISLAECKARCRNKVACTGIEYWSGGNACFECLDPRSYSSYINTDDPAFPPSVFIRGMK